VAFVVTSDVLSVEDVSPCWDLRSSPWNHGPLAVHVASDGGDVVGYAPPGTSVDGEAGLALACWRRATWRDESAFLEADEPEWVEPLDIQLVGCDIPEDFHSWAGWATAAHVARLRAFAGRRPHAVEARLALAALERDLDDFCPDAFDAYCEDFAAEAVRWSARRARRRPEPGPALLRPAPRPAAPQPATPWRRHWAWLATQAAMFGGLYWAYRAVRPDGFGFGSMTLSTDLREPLAAFSDALLWLYGQAHVPLTAAFLLWLYFRHDGAFGFVRNVVFLVPALVMVPLVLNLLVGPVSFHWAPVVPAVHVAIALTVGLTAYLLVESRALRIVCAAYPVLVACLAWATAPDWLVPTRLLPAIAGALLVTLLAWYLASRAGTRIGGDSYRPPVLDVRRRVVRYVRIWPMTHSLGGASHGADKLVQAPR
jgi:hypothetical protein